MRGGLLSTIHSWVGDKRITAIVQKDSSRLLRLGNLCTNSRNLAKSPLQTQGALMGNVFGVIYCVAWLVSLISDIAGHNQRMAEQEREAQSNAEARKRVCTRSQLPITLSNADVSDSLTK